MVIVLVAVRYNKILEWITNETYKDIEAIKVIKRNGGQVYLYVDTALKQSEVVKYFHQIIFEHCQGSYVYQFYGIYHGKIDFYDYLPAESKDKMKYYYTQKKDITDQEIRNYRRMHQN